MSIVIIVCVVIAVISKTRISSKFHKAKLARKMSRATRLSYDKRDEIIAITVAVLSTLVTIVYVIVSGLSNHSEILMRLSQSLSPKLLLLVGFFMIFSWIIWSEAFWQNRKLLMQGYQIPNRKKDYDYIVELLPRTNGTKIRENGMYCTILGIIMACFTIFIGYFLYVVSDRWSESYDMLAVKVVEMSILVIMSLVTVTYFVMSSNRLFRYKFIITEATDKRLPRIQFNQGFTIALVLLILAIALICILDQYI